MNTCAVIEFLFVKVAALKTIMEFGTCSFKCEIWWYFDIILCTVANGKFQKCIFSK